MSDKNNGKGQPSNLTVRKAAEILGASVRTVQKWLNQGHFPKAYKLGPGTTSPWRIPETDVWAFMVQRGQAPANGGQSQDRPAQAQAEPA